MEFLLVAHFAEMTDMHCEEVRQSRPLTGLQDSSLCPSQQLLQLLQAANYVTPIVVLTYWHWQAVVETKCCNLGPNWGLQVLHGIHVTQMLYQASHALPSSNMTACCFSLISICVSVDQMGVHGTARP